MLEALLVVERFSSYLIKNKKARSRDLYISPKNTEIGPARLEQQKITWSGFSYRSLRHLTSWQRISTAISIRIGDYLYTAHSSLVTSTLQSCGNVLILICEVYLANCCGWLIVLVATTLRGEWDTTTTTDWSTGYMIKRFPLCEVHFSVFLLTW